MEAVAKHQGIEFKRGDVLIVRTGYTEAMEGKTENEQLANMAAGPLLSGVEGSVNVAKWVWNKHFAAVASDNPSFETINPTNMDGTPWDWKTLGMQVPNIRSMVD